MFDLNESDLENIEGSTGFDGQQPEVTPAEGQSNESPMFEYQALGKTVKEDIDTILKRASMGYDYAQKMQQFKAEQENFNQQRDGHLQQFGQWKQYHDYASENPDWANFVREQWETRSAYGQPGQAPTQEQTLEQQAQIHPEVARFMEEYRADKRLRQEADEDHALNEQIEAVRKEFPDFDLSQTNPETGASLEMQVLEHARANGINSFKAAFKDLMFDQIMAKKITASKEAAAKEIADRQKRGLISKTETSQITSFDSPIRKNSGSYLDGALEMGRELGLI